MVNLVVVCGAAALLVVGTIGAAKSQQRLRIGVDDAAPPFGYRTDDGRLEGFNVDVAYALCAEIKYDCEMVPGAFSTVIDRLREAQIDAAVVSMSVTDERLRLVDFTEPYYYARNRYVGRPALADVVASDVAPSNLVIGVRAGTTFERFANAELASDNLVVSYPLQEELYLDLALGRLDLALSNELSVTTGFLDTTLGAGFDLLGPRLSDPGYFGRGEAIAVRKGTIAVRDELNAGLARLRADGGLAEIWDRYFLLPPSLTPSTE